MSRLLGGEESRQYQPDCPYPEDPPCGRTASLFFLKTRNRIDWVDRKSLRGVAKQKYYALNS